MWIFVKPTAFHPTTRQQQQQQRRRRQQQQQRQEEKEEKETKMMNVSRTTISSSSSSSSSNAAIIAILSLLFLAATSSSSSNSIHKNIVVEAFHVGTTPHHRCPSPLCHSILKPIMLSDVSGGGYTKRKISLYTTQSSDDAVGPSENEEDEDEARKKRKRDKIKDFFGSSSSSSSSSSPIVEPMPITDAQEEAVQSDAAAGQQQQQQQQPKKRVKAKFDELFQGMPKLDEILSGSSASAGLSGGQEDDARVLEESSSSSVDNISQFASQLSPEELEAINLKFEKLKQEAKARLAADALLTPDDSNTNLHDDDDDEECPTDTTQSDSLTSAECMIDRIMSEQKAREIKLLAEQKARFTFEEYQTQMLKDVTNQDSSSSSSSFAEENNIVRDIIQEAELETEERELDEQEALGFKEYEEQKRKDAEKKVELRAKQLEMESFLKKNNGGGGDKGTIMDIDEIALELMQGLSKESAEKLEVEIAEIKNSIATKKLQDSKSKVTPETMKEWQMMRSISSKMAKDAMKEAAVNAAKERGEEVDWFEDYDEEMEEIPVDQEDLAEKLRLWKEFQEKDAEMRRKAGLTVEVRMPFGWSDANDDEEENTAKNVPKTKTTEIADPYAVRDELDRQSLQALKDLLVKRKGMVGSERLQAQIEALEASIASKQEARVEDLKREEDIMQKRMEEEAKKKRNPVDVSSVFVFTSTQNTKKQQQQPVTVVPDEEEEDIPFFSDGVAGLEEEDAFGETSAVSPPPPPDTPFFSDEPPPPETPFFSDIKEEDDYDDDDDDDTKDKTSTAQQSLGTMEEQKFRKIAAGANVQTNTAEEAELKRKWEEFQQAEQRMRDATGLSEGGDGTAQIDLDLSDVTLEGGDVDAEKVLASLGPRPTKKPKVGGVGVASSSSTQAPTSEKKKENSNAYERPNPPSFLKSQQDSYQLFMEYEEQSRRSMEEQQKLQQQRSAEVVESSENSDATSEEGQDGDEEEEDIIIYHGHATKLDPSDVSEQLYRPIAATAGGTLKDDPDAKEKDKAAYEEYLRKEEEMRKKIDSQEIVGEESSSMVDDMSNVDITDDESVDDLLSRLKPRPTVPKRKTSSGGGIGGSFLGMDDDSDLSSSSSGKRPKKKQRKSSSSIYEQMPDWLRREQAERRREEFETDEDYDEDDEYEDYEEEDDDIIDYKEQERQAAEFERSQSRNKEVNIADIFGRDYFGPDDFGDDYTMTKGDDSTFSSFDTRKETLLEYEQLSVWELNTLMEHKSSMDSASKYLKRINKPYREFGGVFRLEGCLVDLTGLHWQAWKKTAEAFEFDKPTLKDVKLASLIRAETAVQKVFYWTDDIFFAREIAKTHREAVKEHFDQWMEDQNISVPDYNGTSLVSEKDVDKEETMGVFGVSPTESDILVMQTEAWGKAASMYGFAVPTLESMQLAAMLSPEEAITKAFNWSVDAMQLAGMVATYRATMKASTDEWMKKNNKDTYSELKQQSEGESEIKEQDSSNEPLIDESIMLEIQVFAWTKAAEKYGFASPLLEEVQLASWVGAEEAIRDVFKWTSDEGKIREIATTHRDGMKEISAKYIKKFNLKQKTEPEVAEIPEPSAASAAPAIPERSRDQVEAAVQKQAGPTEADIMRLQFESWVKVAEEYGFSPPTIDEAQLATFVSPPEAVQRVFKWANDEDECQKIALAHREALKEASRKLMENFNAGTLSMDDTSAASDGEPENDLPLFTLEWGAIDWLKAMEEVEMPCAVMSNLEREQLDVILEQTGLSSFFPPERRVSSSNGYENESQEMLGGSLRVERRPDHCIVFDTTPSAAVAAHDVDMKIITMIGYYPKYELITSDNTARYFSDLNTVHLRNLFSERVYDEPMVDLQQATPEAKKPQKTRFWEEGDRG